MDLHGGHDSKHRPIGKLGESHSHLAHGGVKFSPSVHGHMQPVTPQQKQRKLRTHAFAVVLADCIDKLEILGLLKDLPRENKLATKYRSLKDLFHKGRMPEFLFNPHTMEPMYPVDEKSKLAQFQLVRRFTEDMIVTAHRSLRKHMGIDDFVSALQHYKQCEEEKMALIAESKENQALVQKLNAQIDNSRADMLEKLQEKCDTLGKLKDDYEDICMENKVKARYIDAWENARFYQNSVIVSRQENAILESLQTAQRNTEDEHKIHSWIDGFLEVWRKDLLEDIERWIQKYDTDVDAITVQVMEIRSDAEQLHDEFSNTLETFEKRKKEIDQYLEERGQREEEERIFQEQTRAATKIQAWWRGMMFRHCLGPYRKKKGKKKGSKEHPKKKKS